MNHRIRLRRHLRFTAIACLFIQLAYGETPRVTPETVACNSSMVNAATPKLRVIEHIQVMKIKRSSHIAVTDELFNAIGAKKFRVYTQVNEDGVPYCIGLLKDSDQSDEKLRLGLNAEQRDALSKVLFSSIKEWQFEQTFWNGKAVVIESSLVLEKNKKKKVLQLVREQ